MFTKSTEGQQVERERERIPCLETSDLHICIVFIYLLYLSIFCCRKQLSLPHPLSLSELCFLVFIFPSLTPVCKCVFLFPQKGKEKQNTAGRCLSSLFSGRAKSENLATTRACVSLFLLWELGWGEGVGAWVRERVGWCEEGPEREVKGSSDTTSASHPPSFIARPSPFFCLLCTVPSAPLVSHRGAKRAHHGVSLLSPL